MVVHWDAVPQNMIVSCRNREHSRVQTISHAICLTVAFLHTCVEGIPAKSQVPSYYLTQFRESRETRNPYDWRTQVRLRCCALPAGSMFRDNRKEVPSSLTFMDGSSLTWSTVRSDSQIKAWTTNLLLSPVNKGALRCVAHPLQDGGLASVCPSYNKDSEPDLWELTVGLRCEVGGRMVCYDVSSRLSDASAEKCVMAYPNFWVAQKASPPSCVLYMFSSFHRWREKDLLCERLYYENRKAS